MSSLEHKTDFQKIYTLKIRERKNSRREKKFICK